MLESLSFLDNELKDTYNSQLHYYFGDNVDILQKIKKDYDYDNIYFNMDYTNYAIKRDNEIKDYCKKNNIECYSYESYLLNPIGTYLKEDGGEYLKFTPFKINAYKINVPKPLLIKYNKTKFDKIKFIFDIKKLDKYYVYNENLALRGGRDKALNILKNIKEFQNYDKIRNILIKNTTNLSPYIKFGCVSIREVYYIILKKLGKLNGIITQLFWREFYYYITYYNKKILEGKSLKEKYNKISEDDRTRLSQMLPDTVDNIRLMRDINNIAYIKRAIEKYPHFNI
jgi:deoxyribodipyrimidine photo-lyase